MPVGVPPTSLVKKKKKNTYIVKSLRTLKKIYIYIMSNVYYTCIYVYNFKQEMYVLGGLTLPIHMSNVINSFRSTLLPHHHASQVCPQK